MTKGGIRITKGGGWGSYLWLIALVLLVGGGLMVYQGKPPSTQLPQADSGNYQSLIAGRYVTPVAEGLGLITRVKLTPDNNLMLVAALTGEVWALARDGQNWTKQTEPLYMVEHGMDVAGENGMTGLIISGDYTKNHFVFLTYTEKQADGQGQNQILRLKVERQGDSYVGAEPTVIFRGNTPVLGAHQIQGGAGLIWQGKPHLLFAIGEAYHPDYARTLAREAGKLLLIQEDGSNPLGVRPYPEYPKIQASGIRNVYDVTTDPINPGWIYFTENGPDTNDMVMRVELFNGKRFDFGWNGSADSLLQPTVDGMIADSLAAYRWEVTVSPVDIVVDRSGSVYFNIFSSVRYPNKEVVKLVGHDVTAKLEVVASRRAEVTGGNLLGLATGTDGSLYFGDMQDGAVYRLWPAK